MGSPCEPLTPRQELIAELEALGYDMLADAPKDWRDSLSDEDLKRRIEAFAGDDEATELPDISELVEAIRETVEAGDGYSTMHPDELQHAESPEGQRYCAAFDRLRALLSDCDNAMEAFKK